MAQINGNPAFVSISMATVFRPTIDTVDGFVQSIFIVTNPEKLLAYRIATGALLNPPQRLSLSHYRSAGLLFRNIKETI